MQKKPWEYKKMEDLHAEAARCASQYSNDNYHLHAVLICTSPPHLEPAPDARHPEHWGEFSENMVGILGTKTFSNNLRRVKQAVEKARAEGQRVVNILFLCRKGRHRSVATSRLSAWALHGNRYNYVSTEHIVALGGELLVAAAPIRA